jgi:hypothetical protein
MGEQFHRRVKKYFKEFQEDYLGNEFREIFLMRDSLIAAILTALAIAAVAMWTWPVHAHV